MKRITLQSALLLIFFACLGGAAADERLDQLKRISAAGAPNLTLKMLDEAQPKVDEDLYEWILWEQERLRILAQWQQWDRMLVRIEGLPVDIPPQFRQQAATYEARAFLELGQYAAAREVLRRQLWLVGAADSAEYETWRRQVIESYLGDARIEDARIALLRFDQDFDSRDADWQLLRARVLIEAGRPGQAILVLQEQKDWRAELTRVYARFLEGQVDKTEIWQQVKKHSADESLSGEQHATLWALAYLVAMHMSPVDRVVALESLFRGQQQSPLRLFQVPVDRLWQAYVDYAELVGNRAELLIGDDARWLELAENSSKPTPVKARSLFAMLILKSTDSRIAERAAAGYMQTFGEIDEGDRILLGNLFNRSETFSSAPRIPAGIRYQLVDLALKSANIDEATRLMSGLDTAPEGASRFDWQLRQSRVLVLGGRYDEGNRVLQNLIGEYREPIPEATDRILQVLFDLQTVDLHEQAIAHFRQLLRLEIEPRQRREILYWIADSFSGMEKYDQAALLYLQSAMLPAPDAMDQWAQSARFNAAENLQKSGLVDDARRIYEELLANTEEPAQRSVLNNKIQRLWLIQGSR
jgi:tetratricopeptide (TPR) repeat protein